MLPIQRRVLIGLAVLLVLHATWLTPAAAETPASESAAAGDQAFDPQQLDALLAPVALYPDTLLTQVLMATTFPLEVVAAARWVEDPAHKGLTGDALTKALEAENWDPSVKSLVPFPQVLAQMNANLEWMQQVGYAFVSQQQAVLDSIQRLRRQAESNGSLKSTPQQVVQASPAPEGQQTIIIHPANADVVYVPSYNPAVVYGTWPYPTYPPVALPPPPGYAVGTALASGLAFGAGVAVTAGLWGWASPNWGRGDVNVNVNRWNNINVNRQHLNSNVWQASARPGGLSPNLRRPPAGPVGRPAHGSGLPANAIGRPTVKLPSSAVNRPPRANAGSVAQGNRPNLSPGSRPRAPAAQGKTPGTRIAGAQPGQANRPNAAAAHRPGGVQAGPGASHVPAQTQRPQNGAFSGQHEARQTQQFAQRGSQSRQIGNAAAGQPHFGKGAHAAGAPRGGGVQSGGGHRGGRHGNR